jgi:hypothetical protein
MFNILNKQQNMGNKTLQTTQIEQSSNTPTYRQQLQLLRTPADGVFSEASQSSLHGQQQMLWSQPQNHC